MAVKKTAPRKTTRSNSDLEKIAAKIKKQYPGKLRSTYNQSGGNMRNYVSAFQDVVAEGYLYDEFNPRKVDKAAAMVAKSRFQQLAKTKGTVARKKK